MKLLIAALVLTFGASLARADQLGDASSALRNKNYAVAVAALTKLADAGNADAALQLGELYWYGEGVPLDRAKGDALFSRAAAAGNKNAQSSLTLSAQRQARLADIAWWVSGYDGADLTSGKFNCVAPTFPPYSSTKREVKTVSESYDAFTACYNAFVDNLAAAMPAGKRIPEELALLMSEEELATARNHLAKVYATVAASKKTSANQVLANNTAWAATTEQYLKNENMRRDQIIVETQRAYMPQQTATGFSGSGLQKR